MFSSINNFIKNLNLFDHKKKCIVKLENDPTVEGDYGDYQIAICQDGKFAVTFDTGKRLSNSDVSFRIIIIV